jgi:cell division initiation protein
MRLSYLDILEQCFHDKFRGYNKQEVDTFLHLAADDFKSMTEEIKEKEKLISEKDEEIKEIQAELKSRLFEKNSTIPPEIGEELADLRKQVEEKNLIIKEMQDSQSPSQNEDNPFSQLTPEMLKKKAKKIINTAKYQAEQYRQDATKEIELLTHDVEKLKEQKKTLMANIKSTAIEHLNKFKAGAPNGGSGNAD